MNTFILKLSDLINWVLMITIGFLIIIIFLAHALSLLFSY